MIDRREFLHTTVAGTAGLVLTGPVSAAQRATAGAADRDAVVAGIKPRHDATVRMLRDWIALPSMLKRHFASRGFGDIEVNMTGGYDPTETAADSRLIRAEQAAYRKSGIAPTLWPRLAGSWPAVTFTGPPLQLPAGQFGLGYGGGAHAPDEFFLIDSANPKVAGPTAPRLRTSICCSRSQRCAESSSSAWERAAAVPV